MSVLDLKVSEATTVAVRRDSGLVGAHGELYTVAIFVEGFSGWDAINMQYINGIYGGIYSHLFSRLRL